MKKLFVLLTVVMTALVFSTGAFADPCSTCKCPLRNVACPTGGQVAATCWEFDYDGLAAAGWCPLTVLGAPNNCKAILSVCDCLPDPAAFVQSLDVGIRMTILVDGVAGENGAYFSAGAPANIQVDLESSWATACALTMHGDPAATASGSFGAHTYYLANGTAAGPLAADPTCSVGATARAVMLESIAPVPGFIIPAVPPSSADYWWIDIPPMRIDPAVIASDSIIQVKIELLDNSGVSLCGGCTLCECTIDIAQACCGAAAATTNLVFPYFASNASFWRGIALVNPGVTSGTVNLTLHNVNGTTATAAVTVPAGGMFVDSLDNITFTGAADPAARSFITATANYAAAEGFAMMGDGNESMGYIVESVLK